MQRIFSARVIKSHISAMCFNYEVSFLLRLYREGEIKISFHALVERRKLLRQKIKRTDARALSKFQKKKETELKIIWRALSK